MFSTPMESRRRPRRREEPDGSMALNAFHKKMGGRGHWDATVTKENALIADQLLADLGKEYDQLASE